LLFFVHAIRRGIGDISKKKKGGEYMCPHQGEKKNKKNVKRNLAFFFFGFGVFGNLSERKRQKWAGVFVFPNPSKPPLGNTHRQALKGESAFPQFEKSSRKKEKKNGSCWG